MTEARIDAHAHVWDLAVRPQPWTDELPPMRRTFEFAELVPSLRRHGFDGAVVVQTVNEQDETPELLRLAVEQPHVLGVVGWTDLTADDVADRVAALRALPGGGRLVGIRHQVQYETGDWLARPEVRRGVAALAEAGLVYELVVTAEQLASAIDVVAALPEVSFVLDHAGKPPIATGELEPWSSLLRRLAALPNVVGKLSGLATEAGPEWLMTSLRPYVDVLADAFGPGRLMFGSDWPVCLLAGSYDQIVATAESLTSEWSLAEREQLFGGTAVRAYGLVAAVR